MKTWLILILGTMCITEIQAQCVVFQEKNGQVYTTCEVYSSVSSSQTLPTAMHNQVTYRGSQFSTFPVWQVGTLRPDNKGKEIKCELAYNMVTNEVLYKFASDSVTRTITPAQFTINGIEYSRREVNLPGISNYTYFSKLYDGRTKLLVSSSKRLVTGQSGENGYGKLATVDGTYQIYKNYFIQKGNAQPEYITLTKKSLLNAFYDQKEKMDRQIPDKDLTSTDAIKAIAYYDSVSISSQSNSHPLLNNAIFSQELHSMITYPSDAWNQAIYSRVYAGFEVSELGEVKNVIILSPQNVGFGFIRQVKRALEKLPRLGPDLAGTYALPVAFTYTNSKEKEGTHSPVNRLADNYLNGRTLLQEFTVPIVVSKPETNSREVWGYYK